MRVSPGLTDLGNTLQKKGSSGFLTLPGRASRHSPNAQGQHECRQLAREEIGSQPPSPDRLQPLFDLRQVRRKGLRKSRFRTRGISNSGRSLRLQAKQRGTGGDGALARQGLKPWRRRGPWLGRAGWSIPRLGEGSQVVSQGLHCGSFRARNARVCSLPSGPRPQVQGSSGGRESTEDKRQAIEQQGLGREHPVRRQPRLHLRPGVRSRGSAGRNRR